MALFFIQLDLFLTIGVISTVTGNELIPRSANISQYRAPGVGSPIPGPFTTTIKLMSDLSTPSGTSQSQPTITAQVVLKSTPYTNICPRTIIATQAFIYDLMDTFWSSGQVMPGPICSIGGLSSPWISLNGNKW